MNINYWKFKPYDDGSLRPDVLIEMTDRAPEDAVPEIIDVFFASDCFIPGLTAALTSIRTSDLEATTWP